MTIVGLNKSDAGIVITFDGAPYIADSEVVKYLSHSLRAFVDGDVAAVDLALDMDRMIEDPMTDTEE